MYAPFGNVLQSHGGAVVIHSPPTFEVCGSNPGLLLGKLVVAYRWLTVYSKEP